MKNKELAEKMVHTIFPDVEVKVGDLGYEVEDQGYEEEVFKNPQQYGGGDGPDQ